MGKTKTTDELAVTLSFFDRIQVFALEILYECKAEHLLIGHFADISRDRRPPEVACGAESSFAGDQLKPPVFSWPNRDRLKKSARL
jgi:hypothetical protein